MSRLVAWLGRGNLLVAGGIALWVGSYAVIVSVNSREARSSCLAGARFFCYSADPTTDDCLAAVYGPLYRLANTSGLQRAAYFSSRFAQDLWERHHVVFENMAGAGSQEESGGKSTE